VKSAVFADEEDVELMIVRLVRCGDARALGRPAARGDADWSLPDAAVDYPGHVQRSIFADENTSSWWSST
jgi:hypothetical protein